MVYERRQNMDDHCDTSQWFIVFICIQHQFDSAIYHCYLNCLFQVVIKNSTWSKLHGAQLIIVALYSSSQCSLNQFVITALHSSRHSTLETQLILVLNSSPRCSTHHHSAQLITVAFNSTSRNSTHHNGTQLIITEFNSSPQCSTH